MNFTKDLIYCVIILGLLLGGTTLYKGYVVKITETRVTKELVAQYDAEYQKKLNKALEVEKTLTESTLNREKEKNEVLKSNNDKLAALVNSLRSRPSKSGSAGSKAPGGDKTCTGAELSREDSEFLAREAARADRILEERNYYYDNYERAREEIDKLYSN